MVDIPVLETGAYGVWVRVPPPVPQNKRIIKINGKQDYHINAIGGKIKMKYYSDKTKQLYESVELLQKAEVAYDKEQEAALAKQRDRKNRAEEIKKAREVLKDAQKNYQDLLNKFVKDYGSYHETYSKESDSLEQILLNLFF